MLSCTNLVSNEIRRRLRAEFGMTLPQFDVLAQLARAPDGLRLGELSRRMMVTNSNVTGLVDRLTADGLILRQAVPDDRRAVTARLTAQGTTKFHAMAKVHEAWLDQLLGELDSRALDQVMRSLAAVKQAVQAQISQDGAG